MAEVFLGVFEGGPYPGSYEFPEKYCGEWPLPKYIKAKNTDEGCYVKYWESEGAASHSNEARGAKYKWDESSAGHDLAS